MQPVGIEKAPQGTRGLHENRAEIQISSRTLGLGGEDYDSGTGSTMTNLPMEPLSTNLRRPLTLANRVSSLPRPTLRPGFTRVPRWRTMMVPPGTTWPPKALNPSRCELESRPLRELPKPFLWAIRKLLANWLPAG